MKVTLTGVEIDGIAHRLADRLEAALKRTSRRSEPRHDEGHSVAGTVLEQIRRELAWDLAPIVCPDDSLLTARQAQFLMGIRKSKWHQLRQEGRVPDPVKTICGDRWYRSAILRCMADVRSEKSPK